MSEEVIVDPRDAIIARLMIENENLKRRITELGVKLEKIRNSLHSALDCAKADMFTTWM